MLLQPSIKKNDKKAKWIIGIFSFVAFAVIVILGGVQLKVDVGFDIHIFATINAYINSAIAIILIAAIIAVKNKKYFLHKKLMTVALILSVLFLISYVAHHILAGDTKFGGTGLIKAFYFFILITHILLAAIILPFILFTTYRGLTSEFDKHKKLAKITFPLWLYVAITGPIIYLLISPYY
jgi:putative membrane protein